jgi:hypothetical protein
MSKTGETFKIISQGALGAMTFGAYHQYTTNNMMKLNNEKVEMQYKYFMDKMENQHKNLENQQKLLIDKLDKLMTRHGQALSCNTPSQF